MFTIVPCSFAFSLNEHSEKFKLNYAKKKKIEFRFFPKAGTQTNKNIFFNLIYQY